MSANYLLRSSTIWAALTISLLLSSCILLFSSDGFSGLQKHRLEMVEYKYQLQNMYRVNLELAKEVHLLSSKDGELYESLARQRGLVRPGETIYTFCTTDEADQDTDS